MPDTKPKGSIRMHPLADETIAPAGFPLDRDLIGRLEASFAVLRPRSAELAERFYAKIFAAHPHLRKMFPDDMTAQNVKLVNSLEMIINGLKHPAQVRTRLAELGATHSAKGVKPEHYPIVCQFMLEAMAELGGTRWTKEVCEDWDTALVQISKLMIGTGRRCAS